MRALFLGLIAAACLAGCSSIMRHNGDFFETGDSPRFEADDQACQTQAGDYAAYDVHGMSGTSYAQTRSYNAVYDRCMTGNGFSPRPYAKNWLPQ